MRASRWERQRAAWLLSHSRPGTSRRRRAELLRRKARRNSRAETGVAETSLHEDVTPSLLHRLLSTDEGPGEKLARLTLIPVGIAVVVVAIGPALLLAGILYAGLWALAPRIGRLWSWPWWAAGAVVAAGGAVGGVVTGIGWPVGLVPWPLGLHIDWPAFGLIAAWTQLALGLALTGARIDASGWRGVKAGQARSKQAVKKNRDGSFRRVADKDLEILVPFQQPDHHEPQAYPAETEPEQLEAIGFDDEPEPDPVETEPVFDDDWDLADIDVIDNDNDNDNEASEGVIRK